ncbi:hypothetical protein GCM10010912_05160 [Paenibacillus albidus]|uniref:Thioredoxin-like fold domain-containing protein n=1 Tax=Paenibacillus albidus TaxID=2041023 RepID=A0A917FBE5_9BACL|nr:DsbA family protein [Paenibacillus albidus]GGF63056.1 hypothetical protein GCM10010912_05160 [Paenibacillus albidus]
MSKPKKRSAPVPQMSKQEKRRAEQEQQKQKTRILIVSTVAIVVIIFVALFMLASKDSSSTTADPVNFNYSEMPRLGNEDAPVKLVEFGDYKCPACAQFAGGIKPQIVQKYIEEGKAALYFVNMAFIGPDSETASLAALSVYHQSNDEFWKFYDAIYKNQGAEDVEWATADYLVELAQKEKLAIDYDLLRKDIENRTYAEELSRDIQLANDSKVTTTPSLFINGVMTAEPFNFEAISAQIDEAAQAVKAE